eukprot:TRINITY_DN7578_c0_g1_i2.p2 TRINITY_DN7578_c0_g1~~TRINITY_DN7578_c0_g1_i2.p2  ORF type:complete len:242 (-),score=19.22 TRINITY_DN7578_c0_g1_i2:72-797(-)
MSKGLLLILSSPLQPPKLTVLLKLPTLTEQSYLTVTPILLEQQPVQQIKVVGVQTIPGLHLKVFFTNNSGWQETQGAVDAGEGYTGGVAIHFGSQFSRSEDYYFVRIGDMRTSSLFQGTGHDPANQSTAAETVSVSTQVAAQRALEQIDTAIMRKDNMRAALGATQNRLEATVESIAIETENLQASESRISDIDVAKEMTDFIRNQVLNQSATSMLSQANALPQMALKIIGQYIFSLSGSS